MDAFLFPGFIKLKGKEALPMAEGFKNTLKSDFLSKCAFVVNNVLFKLMIRFLHLKCLFHKLMSVLY